MLTNAVFQSAWFISRLERSSQQGLRANWGWYSGLHDDLARLIGGVAAGNPFKLGDWHVYNYYTQSQKGLITSAGADSVLWDLYVTQDRTAGQIHALVGNRGQGESFSISINAVKSFPAFAKATKVRVVIKEIPFNGANRVDNPTLVSNSTLSVVNNQVVIPITSKVDSAYTIDLYAS